MLQPGASYASQHEEWWAFPCCLRTFLLINCTLSLNPNVTQTSSYLLPSGDISWITARYLCVLANPAKPWAENLCEKRVAGEQWKMFISSSSLEKQYIVQKLVSKPRIYCAKIYKFFNKLALSNKAKKGPSKCYIHDEKIWGFQLSRLLMTIPYWSYRSNTTSHVRKSET